MKNQRFRWVCILTGLITLTLGLGAQNDDVVSLGREEIDLYNVTTVQDLLNRLPGIYASESTVKIRGSSAVKVLVDGKPINDPLSSLSAIKWGLVSYASIESIHIYKGSGAAMFGEGTDGGAIVITRKKGGSSSGSLLLQGGNLGTFGVELNHQASLGDHSLHSSYEDSRTDGYRENDDEHKYSLGLTDQIRLNDHQSLSVSSSYSWEEEGSPGYPDYPRLHARQASEAFTSSLYYERGDGLKSNLFYRSFWSKSTNPDQDLNSEIESESVGNRTDFSIPLSNKRSLPLGISFESARYKGTALSDEKEQTGAIFSSWMMKLVEEQPLYLSLMGRFNWYSKFDEVFDPSAHLSFKPGKWKLFLATGKGHLAPPFLKRYQSTSIRIPNPNLGMEKTDKLETGLSYAFSEKLSFHTLFYTKTTTDRITYVRLEEGMGQYRNIGKANWLGLETTLSGALSKSFRYSLTHSWMDARDKTHDLILAAAPKHRLQGEVEWRPTNRFKIVVSGKYYGRQYSRSDNTESVPSCSILDARIEYQWRDAQCFLKIKNFLDTDSFDGGGMPRTPIAATIGIKRNF